MKVYQALASKINSYKAGATYDDRSENTLYWENKYKEEIEDIINNLPHGSGIDGKTECDIWNSNDKKIIITSCYHCMNENGYYDGWVDFKITITAILALGFNIKITGAFGKYRDLVLDSLEETFACALYEEYKN